MPNRPPKDKVVPFNDKAPTAPAVAPTTIDELFTVALVATCDMQEVKDFMEQQDMDSKEFRDQLEAYLQTMGFPEEGVQNSQDPNLNSLSWFVHVGPPEEKE